MDYAGRITVYVANDDADSYAFFLNQFATYETIHFNGDIYFLVDHISPSHFLSYVFADAQTGKVRDKYYFTKKYCSSEAGFIFQAIETLVEEQQPFMYFVENRENAISFLCLRLSDKYKLRSFNF